MKIFGICNAQSARKHRRAGHQVQENGDGRFKWRLHPRTAIQLVNSGKLSPSVARKVYHDYKLVPGRVPDISGFHGVTPTAVIVDEGNHPVTNNDVIKLSGRMVEIDHPVGREPKALASLAARYPDGTAVLLETGDRYWPKRRNQHTKALTVLGFMAGTLDVIYQRDGAERPDSLPVNKFVQLIGKRA